MVRSCPHQSVCWALSHSSKLVHDRVSLWLSSCTKLPWNAILGTFLTDNVWQAAPETARVYRWNNNGQQWDPHRSSDAETKFYNSIDEDETASQSRWLLHLQAGDIDTELTHRFEYASTVRRFRLLDESNKSWALAFPSLQSLHKFVAQWEEKLFENTYQLQYCAENAERVCPSVRATAL